MKRRPGRPLNPIPRAELVAAAARVFDRDGYSAATLSELAREVGITKGALFYHFPSKEQLYDALLMEVATTFGRYVGDAMHPEAPWLERLDALGEVVVRTLGTQPHIARLLLRELVDEGPFVARNGRQTLQHLVELIVAFLDEGVALAIVAPQDTRHLAGNIVSLHLVWFGAPALADVLVRTPCDPEQIERRVVEVCSAVRRLCGAPVTARLMPPLQ